MQLVELFSTTSIAKAIIGMALAGVTCLGAMTRMSSRPTQELRGQATPAQQVHQGKWHTPTYLGLTVGKSTKADIERKFGEPVWSGPPEEKLVEADEEEELLYEYLNVGDIVGRTTFVLGARSGVIKAIEIYPQQDVTLQEVIRKYGSSYIERPSNLGPCPTDREVSEFKALKEREYPYFLVYPERGMYISIQKDGTVLEIGYIIRCP